MLRKPSYMMHSVQLFPKDLSVDKPISAANSSHLTQGSSQHSAWTNDTSGEPSLYRLHTFLLVRICCQHFCWVAFAVNICISMLTFCLGQVYMTFCLQFSATEAFSVCTMPTWNSYFCVLIWDPIKLLTGSVGLEKRFQLYSHCWSATQYVLT